MKVTMILKAMVDDGAFVLVLPVLVAVAMLLSYLIG